MASGLAAGTRPSSVGSTQPTSLSPSPSGSVIVAASGWHGGRRFAAVLLKAIFRTSSGSLLSSRIARIPLTTKQPEACPRPRQVAAPADLVASTYLVRRSLLLA